MDRPASGARARLGRRSSRSREVVILALLQPRLRPARLLLRGVVPRERPLHPLERRRLRAVLPLLRLRGGVAPRHRLVARRRAWAADSRLAVQSGVWLGRPHHHRQHLRPGEPAVRPRPREVFRVPLPGSHHPQALARRRGLLALRAQARSQSLCHARRCRHLHLLGHAPRGARLAGLPRGRRALSLRAPRRREGLPPRAPLCARRLADHPPRGVVLLRLHGPPPARRLLCRARGPARAWLLASPLPRLGRANRGLHPPRGASRLRRPRPVHHGGPRPRQGHHGRDQHVRPLHAHVLPRRRARPRGLRRRGERLQRGLRGGGLRVVRAPVPLRKGEACAQDLARRGDRDAPDSGRGKRAQRLQLRHQPLGLRLCDARLLRRDRDGRRPRVARPQADPLGDVRVDRSRGVDLPHPP